MTTVSISNGGLRGFKDTHNGTIKEMLKTIFATLNKNIHLYSVGATHSHTFESRGDLYIFNYSSQRVEGKTPAMHEINDNVTVFGKTIRVTNMFEPQEGGMLISDENGFTVAQYFANFKTINIFIDLLDELTDDRIYVLKCIMKAVAAVIAEEGDVESWVKAKNKDHIIASTSHMLTAQFKVKQADANQRVTNAERKIEELRTMLTNKHRELTEARRFTSSETGAFDEHLKRVLNDFELLSQQENVVDLRIEGDYVKIFTAPLIITDPINNIRYHGGAYTITIRMSDSNVRFALTTGRGKSGYWTGNDPHPHVNGGGGVACLGSIDATVAELCSQEQIYALGIVLIAFLETVNVNDSAGEKVRNWDRVDDSGAVIPSDEEEDVDFEDDDTDEEDTE